MRAALAVSIAMVGVLLGTHAAAAQIVNVQGSLAKPPDEDGLKGELSLKLNWREGNNSFFELAGGGYTVLRRGRWLGLAVVRGGYATSRSILLTKKTFEHLRARVTLDGRWKWEAFGQHEYDEFRRLQYRALAGTGPAFQIVETDQVGILAGASYLLELEELDDRMGTADAGARTLAHRGSFYVTGHEDANETVAVLQTLYFQPRLDEPSDFRLLGELAVQSKLSTWFALRTSFTVAFDTSPPAELVRYDTALEVALILAWP